MRAGRVVIGCGVVAVSQQLVFVLDRAMAANPLAFTYSALERFTAIYQDCAQNLVL